LDHPASVQPLAGQITDFMGKKILQQRDTLESKRRNLDRNG